MRQVEFTYVIVSSGVVDPDVDVDAFNLSHIWDRVLLNTKGLTLNNHNNNNNN